MDLSKRTYWLNGLACTFEDLDGYLFMDRDGCRREKLREQAAAHVSLGEAQSWMNIVLMDRHIDALIGNDDWDLDDPGMDGFLSFIEQIWSRQIQATHPAASFVIQRIVDDEYGDVGLRLVSKAA